MFRTNRTVTTAPWGARRRLPRDAGAVIANPRVPVGVAHRVAKRYAAYVPLTYHEALIRSGVRSAATFLGAVCLVLVIAGYAGGEDQAGNSAAVDFVGIVWMLIVLAVLAVPAVWARVFWTTRAHIRDQQSIHAVKEVHDAWTEAHKAVNAAGSHEDLRAEVVATIRKLMWEGRHDFELVVPHLTGLADATTRTVATRG